jgi:hypothetical protein
MSKPVYMYRAVLKAPRPVVSEDWEGENVTRYHDTLSVGTVLGRRSGYLSRSGAGRWAAEDVEIIRSEPVVFLTTAEKLRKQITELRSQLADLTG